MMPSPGSIRLQVKPGDGAGTEYTVSVYLQMGGPVKIVLVHVD